MVMDHPMLLLGTMMPPRLGGGAPVGSPVVATYVS